MVRATVIATIIVAAMLSSAHAQLSPGELAEAHKSLEGMKNCLKCHAIGAGPSAEKCLACHVEIEQGMKQERGYHYLVVVKQGTKCFACHGDHAGRDFQLVHWPEGINVFDHAVTGYKLEGKHAALRCRDCHKMDFQDERLKKFENVNPERTFLGLEQKCLGCHADEHRGQLGDDCLTCHTGDGWRQTPGFFHGRTAFPLTGRHKDVACGKCHPSVADKKEKRDPDGSFARFTHIAHGQCSSCHEDIHKGQFGADCKSCHVTSGWKSVNQANFDHSKTRFPLVGLHAGVACDDCHTGSGHKFGKRSFERCSDCHEDAHRGQFAKTASRGMCEACHNEFGFTPAQFTVADHRDTKFPLTGAHLGQPCVACHLEVEVGGHKFRRFDMAVACESCHEDVHNFQFADAKPSKKCTACHNTDRWHDVAFDHDRDSSYRLEGEHRKVSCDGCHVPVTQNGVTFVRYKPIDPSCETCHSKS